MNVSKQTRQGMSEGTVSRRAFLKAGGAGAAVMASAQAASAEDLSKNKKLAMVIDLHRCTGCGGCVISCKSENNVQKGNRWADKIVKTTGKFPDVKFEFIPTLCNHCQNAPCVKICPTGAMHKGYGNITMHSPEKCIGCKMCISKCPFGVISFHKEEPHEDWRSDEVLIQGCTSSPEEVTAKVKGNVIPYYNKAREEYRKGSGLRRKGIVEKCTLCDHRVKDGLLPHCVLSCPAKARIFGDINDPDSEPSKLLAKHESWRLKEEEGPAPKVFYIRKFNSSTD